MTSDLAAYAEMINDAWNSRDIEKVISFYSPDYIGDDVGQASLLRGHEGLHAMLENYWMAFPDLQFTVTDTVIQGSRVATIWVAEGTHQGTIMNIPPTGHKVEVRGVSVIDVEDGLIVRGQYIWDLAGMLRHMGLLPEL
ncbi:MAG: ester cyclase [Chloroflexi bacterium]|nr:MAG: ester cyclase [Chloroflexota bacterium]